MVDSRKQQLETEVQHLQKDLTEANRKLSNAEASLQVSTKVSIGDLVKIVWNLRAVSYVSW